MCDQPPATGVVEPSLPPRCTPENQTRPVDTRSIIVASISTHQAQAQHGLHDGAMKPASLMPPPRRARTEGTHDHQGGGGSAVHGRPGRGPGVLPGHPGPRRHDGHRHGRGYTPDRGHAPQRPDVDRAVCGRGPPQGPGAGAYLASTADELAATVAELRSRAGTVPDPVSEPWKTSATARCAGRTPTTGPRTSEPMTAVALLPRRT